MKQITKFRGAFDLGNPNGVLYDDYTQTGELSFSVNSPVAGGWALVPLKANGSAINVPSTWILYGGDDISIVADTINHIQVFYKNASTIYYCNKTI